MVKKMVIRGGVKKIKRPLLKCQICGKILKSDMKKHLANIHGIGEIEWNDCEEDNCGFSTKYKSSMDNHWKTFHELSDAEIY